MPLPVFCQLLIDNTWLLVSMVERNKGFNFLSYAVTFDHAAVDTFTTLFIISPLLPSSSTVFDNHTVINSMYNHANNDDALINEICVICVPYMKDGVWG